ncbi:hypothetical protein INR49_004789 [Caranx melampygus]|nr:hypothetical protein INR49_004789 [Caranx melampygus]
MALNRVSQLCHDITRLWLQLKMMTDDILQREDGPLCAAEIGSELQKQFAILPGGRGMDGNPIIIFPEFPAFSELEEEEVQNVLSYLTSVPRRVVEEQREKEKEEEEEEEEEEEGDAL